MEYTKCINLIRITLRWFSNGKTYGQIIQYSFTQNKMVLKPRLYDLNNDFNRLLKINAIEMKNGLFYITESGVKKLIAGLKEKRKI